MNIQNSALLILLSVIFLIFVIHICNQILRLTEDILALQSINVKYISDVTALSLPNFLSTRVFSNSYEYSIPFVENKILAATLSLSYHFHLNFYVTSKPVYRSHDLKA